MGITAHVLILAGAAIDHTPLLCGAPTWQLTLRPGVRWHDGTRFTSVDAKYSLDRTYDATLKAARLSPFFQTIDRTEAPSPETLVIHTNRPVGL